MNGSRIICTPQSQFILTKINHSWDCIELIFLSISYTCSILYKNYGTFFCACLTDIYFPGFLKNCAYVIIMVLIENPLLFLDKSSATID